MFKTVSLRIENRTTANSNFFIPSKTDCSFIDGSRRRLCWTKTGTKSQAWCLRLHCSRRRQLCSISSRRWKHLSRKLRLSLRLSPSHCCSLCLLSIRLLEMNWYSLSLLSFVAEFAFVQKKSTGCVNVQWHKKINQLYFWILHAWKEWKSNCVGY